LFETIFSRLVSDRVPSKTILQLCFFSKSGMTVGSMNALWLAAPPTTISFRWAWTRAGAPRLAAAAAPASLRTSRRLTRVGDTTRCLMACLLDVRA